MSNSMKLILNHSILLHYIISYELLYLHFILNHQLFNILLSYSVNIIHSHAWALAVYIVPTISVVFSHFIFKLAMLFTQSLLDVC